MIDVINSIWKIPEYQIPSNVWNSIKEPFFLNDLEFYPNKDLSYKATTESLNKMGLNNMYAVISGGMAAKFQLSNSIHKLYHSGVNYTDFTRSQIIEVLNRISDCMQYDFHNTELKGKIEFAVVIEVDTPSLYYLSQNRFKGNVAKGMYQGNKTYGTLVQPLKYPDKIPD